MNKTRINMETFLKYWLCTTSLITLFFYTTFPSSISGSDVTANLPRSNLSSSICDQSDNGVADVCYKCADIAALEVSQSRCCADYSTYRVCRYCLRSPDECGAPMRKGEGEGDEKITATFVAKKADDNSLNQGSETGEKDNLKYKSGPGKAGNFPKRMRPFLGKRGEERKRMRPFLGKKRNGEEGMEEGREIKRMRPFLGKRDMVEKFGDEKRMRPFLGKRSVSDKEEEEKELMSMEMKRMRPFLGKRTDTEDSSVFDFDELSNDKRMRPFLGK